ncbi:MAG: tyrosine-type recombinase/integrase [Anaerolineaceae bacterium]|jgi:integrase|nr:tyrosine-type recombinase/integrase [Anaerolineaceae bacterium]MDD4042504.1 tyrosine-type recombinase/integrase [Anaerolineaceae bacterium]
MSNDQKHSFQPLSEEELQLDTALPSPAQAYLNTLSASGRRTQATALNNLAYIFSDGKTQTAEKFPWHHLRYEHTSQLSSRMVDIGYAKATINKHLVALRRVLEEAYRLGLYEDHNDYYRAAGVKSLRHENILRGRTLEHEELRKLLEACLADEHNPALSARDAALITLMYITGIRRQEVVDLNLSDFIAKERKLRILGKGSKQREVFLSEDAITALDTWLSHRGRRLGPLFTRVSKGGKVKLERLSAQAVYYVLKTRQTQAGLEAFTPHDLRRTTITDMLSADVDVLTVSAIAGHNSSDTTRRYDRRSEESKRQAVERLRSPLANEPVEDENQV